MLKFTDLASNAGIDSTDSLTKNCIILVNPNANIRLINTVLVDCVIIAHAGSTIQLRNCTAKNSLICTTKEMVSLLENLRAKKGSVIQNCQSISGSVWHPLRLVNYRLIDIADLHDDGTLKNA